jgi:hypothetical protein
VNAGAAGTATGAAGTGHDRTVDSAAGDALQRNYDNAKERELEAKAEELENSAAAHFEKAQRAKRRGRVRTRTRYVLAPDAGGRPMRTLVPFLGREGRAHPFRPPQMTDAEAGPQVNRP